MTVQAQAPAPVRENAARRRVRRRRCRTPEREKRRGPSQRRGRTTGSRSRCRRPPAGGGALDGNEMVHGFAAPFVRVEKQFALYRNRQARGNTRKGQIRVVEEIIVTTHWSSAPCARRDVSGARGADFGGAARTWFSLVRIGVLLNRTRAVHVDPRPVDYRCSRETARGPGCADRPAAAAAIRALRRRGRLTGTGRRRPEAGRPPVPAGPPRCGWPRPAWQTGYEDDSARRWASGPVRRRSPCRSWCRDAR